MYVCMYVCMHVYMCVFMLVYVCPASLSAERTAKTNESIVLRKANKRTVVELKQWLQIGILNG